MASPLPVRVRLLPFLARYRLRFAAGTVFLLATNLLQIAIPWALGRGIDALRPGGAGIASARRFALGIAAFALVQAVLRVSSRIAIFFAGRNIEYDLRETLVGKLLGLAPSDVRTRSTGDLLSALTNDLSSVRVLVGFGGLNLANTAFLYVLVLWRLLTISPSLTLLALLPYPALIVIGRTFGRLLFRQSRQVTDHLARMSGTAQEDFSAIAVLKSYGLEQLRGGAFERMCVDFLRKNMHLVRLRGLLAPLMGTVSALAILIVLWLGGRKVIAGELTLGQFAAFHLYLLQLAWPTIALGFMLSAWQRGMASWQRLREILEIEPSLRDGPVVLDRPLEGEIEARGLTIRLGDRPVLDDLSFRIPRGKTVAIVGRTGSGKSTLAEALARLIEVPPGTIFFDGHDTTTLSLAAVRGAIGYAPQEAFLFSTSVKDNMIWGRHHDREYRISLGELVQATALDRDLAAFPAGLDTIVGERGISLSGGQRQRVALARALAQEPQILILDDSLSSVDAEAEGKILRHLRPLLAERTTILISHRVAAIAHADEILVLEQGQIVERGRHAELVRSRGVYAKLYEKQLLERQLGIDEGENPLPNAGESPTWVEPESA